MKTANLTKALLDFWTARAEGVPADQLEIRATGTLCVHTPPAIPGWMTRPQRPLDYSTNWALAGPLLEKHGIDLEERGGFWTSYKASKHGCIEVTECDTPLIAICRAVVRAAFGDEVGDFPNA